MQPNTAKYSFSDYLITLTLSKADLIIQTINQSSLDSFSTKICRDPIVQTSEETFDIVFSIYNVLTACLKDRDIAFEPLDSKQGISLRFGKGQPQKWSFTMYLEKEYQQEEVKLDSNPQHYDALHIIGEESGTLSQEKRLFNRSEGNILDVIGKEESGRGIKETESDQPLRDSESKENITTPLHASNLLEGATPGLSSQQVVYSVHDASEKYEIYESEMRHKGRTTNVKLGSLQGSAYKIKPEIGFHFFYKPDGIYYMLTQNFKFSKKGTEFCSITTSFVNPADLKKNSLKSTLKCSKSLFYLSLEFSYYGLKIKEIERQIMPLYQMASSLQILKLTFFGNKLELETFSFLLRKLKSLTYLQLHLHLFNLNLKTLMSLFLSLTCLNSLEHFGLYVLSALTGDLAQRTAETLFRSLENLNKLSYLSLNLQFQRTASISQKLHEIVPRSLSKLHRLSHLSLSFRDFDLVKEQAIEWFSAFKLLKKLNHLSLASKMNIDLLEILMDDLSESNLFSSLALNLEVTCQQISGQKMEGLLQKLRQIKTFSSLKLGLNGNALKIQILSLILRNLPNLTRLILQLDRNSISDGQLGMLAESLGQLRLLSHLELDLTYNDISDYGIKKLAECLKHLKNLSFLRINCCHNSIEKEGQKSLYSILPSMSSLVDFDFEFSEEEDNFPVDYDSDY